MAPLVELALEQLRSINAERLNQLQNTPIAAVAFDVHGFTLGDDLIINQAIQQEQARLLTQGCALIASTAFGERIKLYVSDPIKKLLEGSGVDPTTVPFYLSTRNGALTTHAFTGDVIDAHPIHEQMYTAITCHPLIRALDELANSAFRAGLKRSYDQIKQLGLEVHPNKDQFPGIRYDWHGPTQAGYQMSVFYDPNTFLLDTDEKREAYAVLQNYVSDPASLSHHEMATIIGESLNRDGIDIATHTAANAPTIDITMPEVNKVVGCLAVESLIAAYHDISVEEAKKHTIGGGDSPAYNDKPLVEYFGFGVTNIDYWDGVDHGLIVLDYQPITDPVSLTLEMFKRIQPLKKL